MHFLSFLLCAFLAAYLFKSLAKALIPFSDRLAARAMGLPGVDGQEVLRRRPRAAAAWNYLQAVSIGALYSLVIAGTRQGFVDLGGAPWLYSLASLLWCFTAGMGFSTHPGSVFFSCLLGVFLNLWFGPVGSLAAWISFSSLLFVFLRRPRPSADSGPVIIDVDPEN